MIRTKTINIKANGRFSKALKEAVERQSFSLTELAQRVDSTYEHMRKLVAGRAYPSRDLLLRLAALLRADVNRWDEFCQWDRLHRQYGGIPKCVQLSDSMKPFKRVVPKLSPEQRATLLAFARVLMEQESRRKHS